MPRRPLEQHSSTPPVTPCPSKLWWAYSSEEDVLIVSHHIAVWWVPYQSSFWAKATRITTPFFLSLPTYLLIRSRYWVMAKIHEVVALTRMRDSKRVPLLVDTCRHFLALFHTSPHHFQRAYIDPTPPLKEVFPDISEVFSSSEHKHKDKHEAEEGADIGNEWCLWGILYFIDKNVSKR